MQCLPTTIEKKTCFTEFFGCPIGDNTRPIDAYGIVIHTIPANAINPLKNNMSSVTPNLLYDLYSVNFLIDQQGNIQEWVNPEMVAWSAGLYCNFELIPNFDIPVLPGWPTHPTGIHIAQSSIHIAIPDNISTYGYNNLVRLIRYLTEQFAIPIDYEHIAHYSEIIQDSNRLKANTPNLLTNVGEYCERCCDEIGPVIPFNQIAAIQVTDIYGCTAWTDPSSIICASLTQGGAFNIDTDRVVVNRDDECVTATTLTREQLKEYVCQAINPNDSDFDFANHQVLVYGDDECLEPRNLTGELILDEICNIIDADPALVYDFLNMSVLTTGPDGCMVQAEITPQQIFDIVCTFIVRNNQNFDPFNHTLLAQTATNCMETVRLTGQVIKDLLCPEINGDGSLFDWQTMQVVSHNNTDCLKPVTLTPSVIKDMLCYTIDPNTESFNYDLHQILTYGDGNCLRPKSLTPSHIKDMLCLAIIDNSLPINLDTESVLTYGADGCLIPKQWAFETSEILTGDGSPDNPLTIDGCEFHRAITATEPWNGQGWLLGFDFADRCLRAYQYQIVTNPSLSGEGTTASPLVVTGCAIPFTNIGDLDQDNMQLTVWQSDGCLASADLTGQVIKDLLCETVSPNGENWQHETHQVLTIDGSDCMRPKWILPKEIKEMVCEEIVDQGQTVNIDFDKLLIYNDFECLEPKRLTELNVRDLFCRSMADVTPTAYNPDIHTMLTYSAAECLQPSALTFADTDCIQLDLTAGLLTAQPIIADKHPRFEEAGCNGLVCTPDGLAAPPCVENAIVCPNLTNYFGFNIEVPRGFHTAQVDQGEISGAYVLTNTSCYKWIVHFSCLSIFDSRLGPGSAIFAYFDMTTDGGTTWTPYSILWHKAHETRDGPVENAVFHDAHWHRYSETNTVCKFMDPGDVFTVQTRVRLGGLDDPSAPLEINNAQKVLGFHRAVAETSVNCPL